MRSLEVLDPGRYALVEDLGRPGYAHLGVAPSGALDTASLRLANRLVGNTPTAAGHRSAARRHRGAAHGLGDGGGDRPGGPGVRRRPSVRLPRAGARASRPDADRSARPSTGLRCYLAVSGGIAVEEVLGSRSRDVLSGIGPAPLAAGDVLPLGDAAGIPAGADVVVPAAAPGELVVPVTLGPRDDWLDDPARGLSAWWTVTAESNRVGLRLDGTPLRRAVDGELPSEGVVTGAIQVPPSGLPVVFLADHPTTGGYPVAAVVRPAALSALAQARPGTRMRFRVS